MPTNLFRAATGERIKRDALVLLYSIGSASSASAAIMRWGDVALGPDPEEPSPLA
jgi:3-oxoacyl-[acyl-carrier-protein] synthase-3